MEVIYTSRRETGPGARRVEKQELLERSDVVSLHCPLTPETRGLVGAPELERMKKTAILVNAARGPLVDEAALVRHLTANPNFSAGLDVFEREPELARGLAELSNAVCVPHIGSATTRARGAMADVCIEEAIRFAKGQTLKYDYFREGES
jgi:glyoxylate reductase